MGTYVLNRYKIKEAFTRGYRRTSIFAQKPYGQAVARHDGPPLVSVRQILYLHPMNREIPFDFIFDYLLPVRTIVKPFFGMFSIYSGNKLLLILRKHSKQPEMNGIRIAAGKGASTSLKQEIPALRSFSGPKSKKKESSWLMIPVDANDFEEAAIRICDLIVHHDPRIGKITRSSAVM
jgi:hypothetical protein